MKCESNVITMLFVIFLLGGCATSPVLLKGYNGPDLPLEEVAIVKFNSPDLLFIGTDTITPERAIGSASILLSPGMNIIKIGSVSPMKVVEKTEDSPRTETYYWPLSLVNKFGGYRVIDMNVEAGLTYVIESRFKQRNPECVCYPAGSTNCFKPIRHMSVRDRQKGCENYTWVTPVFVQEKGTNHWKKIDTTVYDGMLTVGTAKNPGRPYQRK